MIRFVRGLVVAALLGISGCTSLGIGPDASAPPVPAAARAIDYVNDDVAALIFAFDVPRDLQLVQNGSMFSLDFTSAGKGNKHIRATLVLADGDQVEENLPAPGDGRTYYFLGFSPKDQAAIRSAQGWARALDERPGFTATVVPKLCAVSTLDAQTTRISILAGPPGGPGTTPLASQQPLSTVSGDAPLPFCSG